MKLKLLLLAASLLMACTARAQDWRPSSAFIAEGGVNAHGGYSLSGGVRWPTAWRHVSSTGVWTLNAEAFVSYWSSKVADDRKSFLQVGAIPVLRYTFDQGRSPWFAEGGIGVTYMNKLYQRDTKQFSTRFNFIDVIGAGRTFGARNEHEVSLRLAHISNAGIKNPNPGENFLQLRYARNF